ncbi:uncharacterized protein Z518_07044 [Rhinocladiella mackenziei CBS 650.93]|uniref:Gfo/Idh/MocA-like oxidoreductase N-terminal domain-containing protein n=1 Tax=Rhinocladiella mackenziei CBS 650.93 TaxID=1442369 RepID=A0A0D2IJS4_9EURO|nr:uncharacterized protein Z518_07044 [Rhinocladiella mackenziei CBS 650.93]KIX03491.1 hypothetical protein Z518_07044 [Rhinocladiella mackenziei CBS 650.93]
MTASKVLRVGMLGAGEVAQQVWLPTLSLLSEYFVVDFICDISPQAVEFSRSRFHIPNGDTSPDCLFQAPSVDVVFVLTSDELHEIHTIAALAAGKHVFLEKPITLSTTSVQRILDAERGAPNGAKVFVGYMRRYAHSFLDAFKRELSTIPRILYARVRDFPGPNPKFVQQSGISAIKPTDLPESGSPAAIERDQCLQTLLAEAWAPHPVVPERSTYCRFLSNLGSHDLSLMRETLGFPDAVAGVSVHDPFYSAIFEYRDKYGNPYAVTYESGWDSVLRFDAHIAVYGAEKTVSVHYDTPYIKGLPIKVRVDEINEHGEATIREIRTTYEDAYTTEAKELWACLVEGKEIKTSATDAADDVRLIKMMLDQFERQKCAGETNGYVRPNVGRVDDSSLE